MKQSSQWTLATKGALHDITLGFISLFSYAVKEL